MQPIKRNLGYRIPHSILDGACFPENHKEHYIVEILEHIPKCCSYDYVHNSKVMCSCGEIVFVSDQFINTGDKHGSSI